MTKGNASENSLKSYYEIYGTGQPLLLLHGAFSDIEIDIGLLTEALHQRAANALCREYKIPEGRGRRILLGPQSTAERGAKLWPNWI